MRRNCYISRCQRSTSRDHLISIPEAATPAKDTLRNTNDNEAGINQAESARSANASAAVHDGWSHVRLQCTRSAHMLQKLEEGHGRRRHSEIRPCCVVELNYFTTLHCLGVGEPVKTYLVYLMLLYRHRIFWVH